MAQGNIIYSNLEELSSSNYKLTAGEADIRGWSVRNEAGIAIGSVRDLLFDPEHNTVRYMIINLDRMGSELEGKTVLIPIGLGTLAEDKNEIILPDIHLDQFRALPQYIIAEVTHQMEDEIRRVIGSPAALRMEETIIEIDRANFYRHHHFDRSNQLNRGDRFEKTAEADSSLQNPEREAERETIHQLIDQSAKENLK